MLRTEGVDAYNALKKEIEAANAVEAEAQRAREAGEKVSKERVQALIAERLATEKLTDATADLQKRLAAGGEGEKALLDELSRRHAERAAATEQEIRDLGKINAARDKAAQEAADLALEPIRNAVEDFQSTTTNAFDSLFSGTLDSAQDFADEFVGVFRRLAANMLSLAIFNPQQLAGIFGVGSAPTTGQPAEATALSGFLGSSGGAGFGNLLRGATLGAGAGGFSAQLTGGQTVGGTIGGAIGGAGGFALGTAFPIFGPATPFIGSAVGGALGGIVGGLFGGGGGGNNRAGSRINIGTGRVSLGNDQNSAANQQIVDKIVNSLAPVVDFVKSIGGTLPKQEFRIRLGDKSGADLTIGSKQFRFNSPEQLTVQAIKKIVRAAEDIPKNVRRASNKSKAGTAEGLLEDIQFGATFDDLVNSVSGTKQAFDQLVDQFDAAAATTKRLKLDEQALQDARTKAIDKFLTAAKRDIDALVDPGSAFKQQLIQLEVQFDEAAQVARELGFSEQAVAEGRQRAIDELLDTARRSIDALVNPASAFGQELQALQLQFDEAAKVAKELGFSQTEVEEGRARAIERLTVSAQRSIAALTTPMSSFKQEMEGLLVQFEEAARIAKDLGLDEAAVGQARVRALQDVRDRARDAFDAIVAPASDFKAQIDALNASFDEAAILAREFGFSEGAVSAARRQAISELTESTKAALDTLINPASDLIQQFDQLTDRFAEATKLARDLGVEERQVAQARERAIGDLLASAEDSIRSQAESIRSFFSARIEPLRNALAAISIGTLSTMTPISQVAAAQAQFEQTLASAREGTGSFQDVASIAQQVVQLGQQTYGSTQRGLDITKFVTSDLEGIIAEQQEARDDILEEIPDGLDEVTNAVDQMHETLRQLLEENRTLRRRIEAGNRIA